MAGVSKTASLVVDGVNMGSAITYSKKKALAVVPGRHVVEVREGGRGSLGVGGAGVRVLGEGPLAVVEPDVRAIS